LDDPKKNTLHKILNCNTKFCLKEINDSLLEKILGLALAAKIEVMQENGLIVKFKKILVKISANVFAICPCSFF